jgi:hypothetical protein
MKSKGIVGLYAAAAAAVLFRNNEKPTREFFWCAQKIWLTAVDIPFCCSW